MSNSALRAEASAVLRSLARAFDEYYALVSQIYELAVSRGPEDAMRLICIRRELSQKISDILRMFDDAVGAVALSGRGAAQVEQHRLRFSAERRAVAIHQAKWSAPAMHRDRAGYEIETSALFRIHSDNHRWRKCVLMPELEAGFEKTRLGIASPRRSR